MITKKLTQSEIKELLLIKDPFKKRDYIQQKGLGLFKESKGQLLCRWATSLGKTIFAKKIIQRFLELKSNFVTHIVVPTDTLKKQWEEKLEGILNFEVYIVNTYATLEFENDPDLIVYDECHKYLNKDSVLFSKVNYKKSKYKLYLSATLKREHLKYVSEFVNIDFEIDIMESLLLGFIPEFKIYNYFVDFTDKEKAAYKQAVEIEEDSKRHLINLFGRIPKDFNEIEIIEGIKLRKIYGKIPKEFEITNDKHLKLFKSYKEKYNSLEYKNFRGILGNFLRNRTKRITLITNAENKLEAIKHLLKLNNKKTILFSKTIKRCEILSKIDKENTTTYHSGLKPNVNERNLKSFMDNEKPIISSVFKLIAGFDDESAERIIRDSYNSSKIDGQQELGKRNLPN